MHRITELEVRDIRFPTSLERDGSDAMNPDPDYSAAYVVLETDRDDGLSGHGLAFTIGRGTEVVVKAIEAMAPLTQLLAQFLERHEIASLVTDAQGRLIGWITLDDVTQVLMGARI